MKLIVGLGNPGQQYLNTRHNIGFGVLDHLLEDLEPLNESFWDEEKKIKGQVKKVIYKGTDLLLLKPTTYMNLSGMAVRAATDYYKILPEDIIVVYDDVDIPLGTVRTRMGGAAGGHKGVLSIIDHLGTDKFLRIRLGIGHPGRNHEEHSLKLHKPVEDFVLGKFERNEKGKVKTMMHHTIKNIKLLLEHGIDLYMSKYNLKAGIQDKDSEVSSHD